jgi:molybdopterin-guanine dinucleotide biosynthesis protein A
MIPVKDITGVILAGGRSRRFGSNKALALYHGKFLIRHVRDCLAAVFSDILLSTNSPGQFSFLNLPMVKDKFQHMGPLAGIHAALQYTGKKWIFVAGCDMPAIAPALVNYLCRAAEEDSEAVIPWLATGPEPLCGLYQKTALAAIEQQLKNKNGRVQELLARLAIQKIIEAELQEVEGGLQAFVNVNRMHDLDSLS